VVNIVRQTEIQTAEPIVSEPSALDVEMAIGELRRPKSRTNDQSSTERIKAGVRTICSKIHKLVICVWIKVELNGHWYDLIFVSIYKRGDKEIVVIIEVAEQNCI